MLSEDVSIIDVTLIIAFSVLLPLSPIHINGETIIEYVSILVCTFKFKSIEILPLGELIYNLLTALMIQV